MSIHSLIRRGRERLNLSEEAFGKLLDVSRGTIQQWEKEGGTAPNRKRQPAVAELLGISVSQLMSGVADQAGSEELLSLEQVLERLGNEVSNSAYLNTDLLESALASFSKSPNDEILRGHLLSLIRSKALVKTEQPGLVETSDFAGKPKKGFANVQKPSFVK